MFYLKQSSGQIEGEGVAGSKEVGGFIGFGGLAIGYIHVTA